MKEIKSKPVVYIAWLLVASLFMVLVKYKTDISWAVSITLSLVTGIFGCVISMLMCWWTDRQKISRLSLIIFCGVGLVMTLVIPAAKDGSFDHTGMRMLLFTAAGLILTAFFLPKAQPKK